MESLLSLAIMGLIVYFIVRQSRKSRKYKLTSEYRQRPPTVRQMAFIDSLIEERNVASWMLEKEPETIQEASELIDELKKMPPRQEDMI